MTDIVIDHVDDELKNRLEELARDHGHSIAEEVRDILRKAVPPPEGPNDNLGTRLARRFAGQGLDFEIPELRFGEIKVPSFEP
jgi:plasmid stability protein